MKNFKTSNALMAILPDWINEKLIQAAPTAEVGLPRMVNAVNNIQ